MFLASAGKDTVLCSNTNSIGVPIGAPPVLNVTYSWQPSTGLSATNIAQPIANPAQSTWYYLTATDTTATDCAVNTDSVYVEVRTCTGVSETAAKPARIYPNPTTGLLTLELLQHPSNHTFTLYNLLGERILDKPLIETKTSITLDFPPGIYLYQITGNAPRHGVVQNGKLVLE